MPCAGGVRAAAVPIAKMNWRRVCCDSPSSGVCAGSDSAFGDGAGEEGTEEDERKRKVFKKTALSVWRSIRDHKYVLRSHLVVLSDPASHPPVGV